MTVVAQAPGRRPLGLGAASPPAAGAAATARPSLQTGMGGGNPPGQGRCWNIHTRQLLGTEPRIHINPRIDCELNGAKAKVPIFMIGLVGQ